MLTFYNLKIINQAGIEMSAMIVLKTTSDVASSSFLDAAWDINKTDIAVGAAD